jgi:hypothetical protein
MYEGTLPRMEWKYNYGIDVLFSALKKSRATRTPRTKALQRVADYSTVLELILKESPFRNALADIQGLPHGEELVNELVQFCTLPRKDIALFESVYSHYLINEKEKLLLLDRTIQREWPIQPFEVYFLSGRAGQVFNVGRTSFVSERTFFIPFRKRKAFMDSVTHELIHFKVNNIFKKDLFSNPYQRFIAQEVAVRVLDVYLNRVLDRKENISYKKIEMAALGCLPLFLCCLNEIGTLMKGDMKPDEIRKIRSIITQKCHMMCRKDVTLSLTCLLFENPRLLKDILLDTIQYMCARKV